MSMLRLNQSVSSFRFGFEQDPKLAQHLARWGIDVLKVEKTDKTMAELEVRSFQFQNVWVMKILAGKDSASISQPYWRIIWNITNNTSLFDTSHYVNALGSHFSTKPCCANKPLGTCILVALPGQSPGVQDEASCYVFMVCYAWRRGAVCIKLGQVCRCWAKAHSWWGWCTAKNITLWVDPVLWYNILHTICVVLFLLSCIRVSARDGIV